MAEKPILFSAPMVRAILAGTKTQTRRVVKPQPERRVIEQVGPMLGFKKRKGDGFWLWPNALELIVAECSYGQPGTKLWVRETWRERVPDQDGRTLDYRADHTSEDPCDVPWCPSIHMPRWASRITLEVTGVRVEKLQDISEADAIAEGVNEAPMPMACMYSAGEVMRTRYREAYAELWEQINGPGSWDANPWVWCVSFRRLEAA